LSYLDAILRVYNRYGRRDNIHKARIKILVKAVGIARFRDQVETEWRAAKDISPRLELAEVERIRSFFAPPAYESLPDIDVAAGSRAGVPGLVPVQHAASQGFRLSRGLRLTEGARRKPWRYELGTDGSGG